MIEDSTYWFTFVMFLGTIIYLLVSRYLSDKKWDRFWYEEMGKQHAHYDKMREFYLKRQDWWYEYGVITGKAMAKEEEK